MAIDTASTAPRNTPPLTAVQSNLDHVIEQNGVALNTLKSTIELLEKRLSIIMDDAAPVDEPGKLSSPRPSYGSPIVRFIDDMNDELVLRIAAIDRIIARLPT